MEDNISVNITYHRQRSSTARIRGGKIFLRVSSMVSRREQQRHIDELLGKMKREWGSEIGKIALSLRPILKEIVVGIKVRNEESNCELLLSTGVEYRISVRKAQSSKYKVQKLGDKLVILWPI